MFLIANAAARRNPAYRLVCFGGVRFAILVAALFFTLKSEASGTWLALSNQPPTSVNTALVLSDGSIFTDDGSGDCNKLTPDIHGSYANGTWSHLASMNWTRMFFAREMLTNGNIFVAGGEYGQGSDHAELYDSLKNVWTKIPDPIPSVSFSDDSSKILPNGNVFVPPVSQFGGCLIYNVASNLWQIAASTANQDETCWVKLANDNILTIDTDTQNAEHYVPSMNQWFPDNQVPVPLYGFGEELGAGFLLPNGNVFYIGATTNTGIYTPGAGVTNMGTWVAGPVMVFGTNQLGAVDAPAAMMVNGKILAALGPVGGFNSPTYFYEYDYVSNVFTAVTAPGGGSTYSTAPFVLSMLDLPDGNVLFVGGQNTKSLYVYIPDGTALAAGQPVINTITQNVDGSYHLTGTGLNGISEGAAYGDDEQMNSNYPLVRMTNNVTSNVYYARTFNWNSTGVQTGSKIVTTEFTLPPNLPTGAYSLVVVANGNSSSPVTFTNTPVSVPTGLTATSGSNGFVTLSWNSVAGATAYNLKRASTVAGPFITIATLTGLSFTNTGLTNGLAYYYKIAAVGNNGPSGDSATVIAKPSGPSLIPGATAVTLTGLYNRTGIYSDGLGFSSGMDNSGSALSANLLPPSVMWNNLIFNFGSSNALDVISCTAQVVTLPAGRFNSLQILATAVNGGQTSQVFTVTYTDNSTVTFTQSFSDWANAQSYEGETTVVKMPYRDQSGGTTQFLAMTVDGYIFPLDQTRTVKNITLPNNANVIVLSMMLANDPVPVALDNYFNRPGLYTDGTTFTNPATGGLDGGGSAFSASLLGSSQVWTNTLFTFGPANLTNVISCTGQTITLPPGNYSRVRMLATGVKGNQTSQSFTITYTDASTTTVSQSLSDWFSPQNYTGESQAIPMSYRNSSNGKNDNRTFYLYGYSFVINNAKVVQSIQLPNDTNVVVVAITLVPNWPPTFTLNPFAFAVANSGSFFSSSIATNASDLNGDSLTYAKVSGPAWLSVAANGFASGVPANSDANTNTFVVSVTDSGSLSNTATLSIYVNGAPTFAVNPFTLPGLNSGQSISGTIATNASDPNPGDVITFGKASGPAWLTVAANGTLSGTPADSDANTNVFVVSAADQRGLSRTATLNIYVNGAPAFAVNPFSLTNITAGQTYSGTIATSASDPNPGDVLSFAKLNGPAWLAVGTNGSLSGMPLSANIGSNSFVVSVSDSGGLSNVATMNISVTPAPGITSSFLALPGGLQLNWNGGIGPYQIQATPDLRNVPWQNLGGTITSNSLLVVPTNSAMFYRILGN